MPCNAAATLYNKSNGKVSVVGINTLGVLYILDNKGEVTNVSDLKGRTIYTTGKGTTPEYTLRYLLNTNGIDPDKDVHIEFKSEASEGCGYYGISEGRNCSYASTAICYNSSYE